MSFKPSKKTLIKLSAAASNSHDKPADPSLSIQPSTHDGRSRKSFFSFKSTSKRYLVRPSAGHESTEAPNSTVKFPLANAVNGSNQPSSTNSPPQLPSTRTLRSSILFSQQFDFSHLGSSEEPIHRDPSPTSLQSETTSRPLRSTTRPSSWMMLKDGTYAPSLKAQVQCLPKSDQRSPESFYNRSTSRVPRPVDSSDDDGSSHVSAASWNRLPSVPPEQPSDVKCILAGYKLQTPTQAPLTHVPPQSPPQAVARSASKPAHVLSTSNVLNAPASPPKGSDYSPLAAFLGQSKPTSRVDPNNPAPPSNTTPSSFLSAFLGNHPSEHPKKNPSLAPLPSSSLLFTQYPRESQSAEQSPRLGDSICLKEPSRVSERASVQRTLDVEQCVTKLALDISPLSDSLLSSRTLNQFASRGPQSMDAIDATGIDRTPEREQPTLEPVPSSATIPSCSTTALVTFTSSPPSTTCYTSSHPSASNLEEKSISQDSLMSDSALAKGPDSLKNLGPFQKCGSRKRGVEKVYLDSSSQHSSMCSDNSDSVDDAMRKCAIDSDLSGALTDPSSTSSHSGSPDKTLKSLKEYKEEPEVKIVHDQEANAGQQRDSSSDRVPELTKASIDAVKNTTDAVSDNMEEEAEGEDDNNRRRTINFEHLLLRHPEILRKVVSHLDYLDFFSLSQITNDFLEELESDPRLREIILKRYLAGFGYRSSSTRFIAGKRQRELPMITLDDLTNFYAGLEFESLELIEYSKQALNRRGLDYRTAKMIRSSTRAHNKLVAYMRAAEESSANPGSQQLLPHRHAGRSYDPIYRPGKAPVFKVWVPSADHWMSNEELAECERELWRSQIWSYLKKGDVCWNLAIGDFANEGKLIFDGKFLRDLLFDFDEVGHLPSWLDMLAFPPSYYHKIISSSTSTPIFYLDLSNYKDEIKKNLKLSQDKVEVASPQARYRVQRWVYRSIITVPTGEWIGHVVIEVEGTSEQAKNLMKRCYSNYGDVKNLTPWRIIREKSRPGKLWIRPVNDDERIN